MNRTFEKDSYQTPADRRRAPLDYVFLQSRWYFLFRYLGIVISASGQARAGRYDDPAWNASSFKVFDLIEDCGGRFSINGFDNLRRAGGPVVLVANHMSTLETMVLPCLVNPILPITFVVKEKLVRGMLFGPVMRARNPVLVGRKNPRDDLQAVLEGGQAVLEAGRSMIIFPESTRSEVFDPEAFNSLGVKLARRAAVPLLPLAIKSDFWGNGRRLREAGPIRRERTIHFEFGAAMTVSGQGREEHRQVVDFISGKLESWGAGIKKSS